MKKIITYLFLLSGLLGFAQGENNNWYFGPYTGLNFASNPPTVLSGSSMQTLEGIASISKANGSLLFYTDGKTIWNRSHQVMLNGSDLVGGYDSQHVVIAPYPGNNTLYYVFTTSDVKLSPLPGNFCNYTIVDMSLGSVGTDGLPLGGVVTAAKNISLLNEFGNPFTLKSETIAMTPHADNKSYWILFANGSRLYSYRLDTEGFHATPLVSNLPAPVEPEQTQIHIRVSPNLSPDLGLPYSNLIALSRWPGNLGWPVYNYGTRVCSFNNSTGLITSDYFMNITDIYPYSSEFSSDGKVLYTVNFFGQRTMAFDVFNGVGKEINQGYQGDQYYITHGGSAQRAVNGEIYVIYSSRDASYPNWKYLGMINNPDSYQNCSVNLTGLYMNAIFQLSSSSGICLPPLVPILNPSNGGCFEYMTLGFPEENNTIHHAGSSITTNNNYTVNNGQDITLKAGSFIEMRPNSFIKAGSIFLAKIEECAAVLPIKPQSNYKPVNYTINVENNNGKMILYPNPSANIVTVSVAGIVIKELAVYSSDGKQLLSRGVDKESYVLDVSDYTAGIYIITVTGSDNKIYMEKLVKK